MMSKPIGMAADEVGTWIAKRDKEYEDRLASLSEAPDISSQDDLSRTIYSAMQDCPATSEDKIADFIARAFWPKIEALRSALTETKRGLMAYPLDDQETCMCGDAVSGHNMGSGHAPVTQGDHALKLLVEGIDEALS
jgi:hypothetical protein